MASRLVRPDVLLSAATFLLHAAFADRYGFFRDELYFIACGRHPAFGYVDQPPLVPLVAAATQAFGEDLVLLRLVAALGAAGAVYVTCALVRLCGGGTFAQTLAGVAVALALVVLALTTTLNTSSFEPLAWTLVAYLIARAVVLDEGRALLWAGLATGVALQIKYEIPFWLFGLFIGLLAVPERRIFARRELWFGLSIAALIAAPSVVWQAAHHWPFAELLAAAPAKNAAQPPLAYLLDQVVVWNPVFAPLWIAGALAPLLDRRLAPWRWLALAFLVVLACMLVLHGKDYYMAGAFPSMLALGAVLCERRLRNPALRAAYVFAGLTVVAIFSPLVLPVLAPNALVGYMRAVHQSPSETEKSFRGALLPQHFADQLGWRDFARQVGGIFASLPPEDRARTALVTSNYGEAGALDFYGPAYGLPPALSGHNSYYLWGTHGYGGSFILRINGSIERYRRLCRSAAVIATVRLSPLVMPEEREIPVILCRGLREPLPQAWPRFKHYE
ncbi:MAG: glycosyltransferase family 39 protein [Candidatus Eremiobacteraeota bacterium]|nr:glycosyltransferase family 39 protein [Candidatus Eremiobacteraeota bacterium]